MLCINSGSFFYAADCAKNGEFIWLYDGIGMVRGVSL